MLIQGPSLKKYSTLPSKKRPSFSIICMQCMFQEGEQKKANVNDIPTVLPSPPLKGCNHTK